MLPSLWYILVASASQVRTDFCDFWKHIFKLNLKLFMLKTLPSFPSNYSFCSANSNEFTALNVNYDDESHLVRLVLLSQRVNLKKTTTVPTVSFTKLRRRKKKLSSLLLLFAVFATWSSLPCYLILCSTDMPTVIIRWKNPQYLFF